jgi:hypothetical protein
VIVLGMTILSFFVAVFWIIVRRGLERTFKLPENRQRLEAIKHYWKGKQEPA